MRKTRRKILNGERSEQRTILGKTYTYNYVPGNKMPSDASDEQGKVADMGDTHSNNLLVSICIDYPIQQQEETAIHETLHIGNDELSMGLSERQVHTLSVFLYHLGFKLPSIEEKEKK
jgi:hypothetical protein